MKTYKVENGKSILVSDATKLVGAGDVIAAATSSVGLSPCGACKRRQEALNAVTPSWARRLLGRLFRR